MARAAASGLADGSSSAIGTARCWRKRPERLGPIHSRRDIETEFFNRIQRQRTVTAPGRAHADRHQAVIGPGEQLWLEWLLYEVLRP